MTDAWDATDAEASVENSSLATASAQSLTSLATVGSSTSNGSSTSTSECPEFGTDDRPVSEEFGDALSLRTLHQHHHHQQQQPAHQRPRKRSNAISARSMSSYLTQYKEAKGAYFDAVLSGGSLAVGSCHPPVLK